MQLDRAMLQEYLAHRHGATVEIRRLQKLGDDVQDEEALKQFAYGDPVLIEYVIGAEIGAEEHGETEDGAEEDGEEGRDGDARTIREVLHRIRRTPFGRERADDRVAAIWLDYRTFNRLPRHVPATDLIAHLEGNGLTSLDSADELMLVTGYRPGHVYADDLTRLRDGGELRPVDVSRAETLARYLARIHATAHDDAAHGDAAHEHAALWRRRLRDLVGHGEGVMGLTDSYPADFALADRARLRRVEEAINGWRWRLKERTERLRQVHGDFHPFNILFDQDDTFFVLDRSRGEWGEPADDVSCLTINYLFFSLQRSGDFSEPFRTLYDCFWAAYMDTRHDPEITAVIQPWYAWRALVVASPTWYPTLQDDVRRKLLAFCQNVLAAERFDIQHPERYWQDEV